MTAIYILLYLRFVILNPITKPTEFIVWGITTFGVIFVMHMDQLLVKALKKYIGEK